MTWLARLSLANRAVVGLVTVLVLVFGVVATGSLRQELFPSLQIPQTTVIAAYPGASPDVVEQQVAAPIEDAVADVDGVTATSSTSSSGSAVVRVDLEYGTDLGAVSTEVQRAVLSVELPEGVEPRVVTGSIDDFPVVLLAASADLDPDRLAAVLRDQVQPLLAGLDGVREVTLGGLSDPRVTIRVNQDEATRRGISPTTIPTALRGAGVQVPAGELPASPDPLTVQVGSPITSVEQVQDLYLTPVTGGPPVRLGDIATVAAERAPPTGYTRTNGQPSVSIGVVKEPDANTVAVSDAVRDALPQVEDLLGAGASVTPVFDQAPFIEQSVEDLTTEGLLGLLFAVLVILGFLLSVRATLVTAASIPLSVLIAMIVLYSGGYTLNILTLGALTVAVGRVVDDSIVVIENIKRHLGLGESRRTAVVEAVREVAGAITASTFTTVAVFAPIGFVGGQVGELFRPFAITVTAALLASLLVSLTVVPVLASAFMHRGTGPAEDDRRHTRLQRAYLPTLRRALARPGITLLIALGILAGTAALLPRLETNFLGDAGEDTFTITQELPAGAGLATADVAAREIEEVLADTDGVQTFQVTVGSPGGGGFGPPQAAGSTATRFSVTLDPESDVEPGEVQDEVRAELADRGGAGTITVQAGQGPVGGELEVLVRADDDQVLAQAAAEVQEAVADVPGAEDVRNNLAAAQSSVAVTVDRARAAENGLTEAQVGQAVAGALRGTPAGSLTIDGVAQDVLVLTGTAPGDLEALRNLALPTPRGTVPLRDVAAVEQTSTTPTISRQDGERTALITARPAADDLGAVTTELRERLDALDLPAGATAEIGGVSEEQSEAFASLGLALLLAIAAVYLVMVLTFRSLLQPLILLVSVPFAATGSLGLLVLTGTPMGVPALIGMLMLVGIVVTNAIVLIDLVNQYREAGRRLDDAVFEGARHRLRPILMTAVATVFALLPMAFGLTGGGVFISQPLAIVVIGGLITSTLLTLVLVPVLYTLVERARARLRRRRRAEEPTVVLGTGVRPRAAVRAPARSREPATAQVPATTATATAAAATTAAVALAAPGPDGNGHHRSPHPSPWAGPVLQGTMTDPRGRPLPGAPISVLDAAGGEVARLRAGPDGSYAAELPAAGRYAVVTRGARRGVAASALHHDVAVDVPGELGGTVRDASGPVAGVRVSVAGGEGPALASTVTDAAGLFRVRGLAPGEHLLVVAPTGRAPVLQRVTVPATGAVHRDVVLPAARPRPPRQAPIAEEPLVPGLR